MKRIRWGPLHAKFLLSLLALLGFSLSTLSTYELLAPKAWATEQTAYNCQTTLNGGITSGATSIIVNSAACLPTTGTFSVLIDQEAITITAVSGTTLTGTRTENGTNAAHSSGAAVTVFETPRAINQIKADAVAPALAGMYPSL